MPIKAVLFSFFIAVFLSGPGWASGSSDRGFGRLDNYQRPAPPREPRVDEQYEYGKAMLSGRLQKFRGVDFCLTEGDRRRAARISRYNLTRFRDADSTNLFRALTDCRRPELDILQVTEPAEAQALVHYLNSRYDLRLVRPTR